MLALYGDGSGEHGKGVFVLAGYVANTLDWFAIEQDWCRELQTPPRIDYFKASECVRKGDGDFGKQFKGWTQAAVDAKRLQLAMVVNKFNHRMVEVASTINWDEYRSAIGDDVVKQTYYHPYFFCFHGLASLAVEVSNKQFRDHKDRLAFVMDTESNATLDVDVKAQYEHARSTLPGDIANKMGSITFDTDIKFPLLQVADLIAWSVRAEREGLPSPVLSVIRDGSKIGGSYERRWNPSKLAQMVIDTEDEFKRRFPPGAFQKLPL